MMKTSKPFQYEVIVRRENGRYVFSKYCSSKYSAKVLRRQLEDKYATSAPGFYIEIRPLALMAGE